MTRSAAANGHPIEFWLTVFPAAGIFIAGWGSLLLRAINRLCHDVAQPETASIPMVSTTRYGSTHLHRHPHVRRFGVVYVIGIACMLVLALVKQIVGFSDALFTDLALGLVVLGAAATPLVLLGGELHSNRDLLDARPSSQRIPLLRYGHREHKP